jgi:hypothetical protein
MTNEEKIASLEKKITQLKKDIPKHHHIVQVGLQMWLEELEEALEIIKAGGQDPFAPMTWSDQIRY